VEAKSPRGAEAGKGRKNAGIYVARVAKSLTGGIGLDSFYKK